MTISDTLNNLDNIKTNIRQAIIDKGVTVSSDTAFSDYPTKIGQISGGGSGVGIPRAVDDNGVYGYPDTFTFTLPSNAIDLGQRALYYTFQECTNITSADLSSLTTISGYLAMMGCFKKCTGLTSVDLSNLTTVSGDNSLQAAFLTCSNLTSIDLSSLTTINGDFAFTEAFRSTGFTSITFPNLSVLDSNSAFNMAFYSCYSLTSISFPALTSNSFGSYVNQFSSMLNSSVRGCTVHFPSNLESVIGSWSSVTAGFGGTNTTVLYDLPATT